MASLLQEFDSVVEFRNRNLKIAPLPQEAEVASFVFRDVLVQIITIQLIETDLSLEAMVVEDPFVESNHQIKSFVIAETSSTISTVIVAASS